MLGTDSKLKGVPIFQSSGCPCLMVNQAKKTRSRPAIGRRSNTSRVQPAYSAAVSFIARYMGVTM